MCGRYVLNAPEDLSERFQLRDLTMQIPLAFNVAPTDQMPVIIEEEDGSCQIRLMQWGLAPRWSKRGDKKGIAPINARAETLNEKPMFRDLVKHQRCLVPANGFYEWQQQSGGKQPYYITLKDQETFAFAGLYDEFSTGGGAPLATYAIITTAANPLIAPIHNRMPVILAKEAEAEWLDPEVTDPLQVERLLLPYAANEMTFVPVSKLVNNARNEGPQLIEPIDDPVAGDH